MVIIKDLFRRVEPKKGLLAVETASFLYNALTTLLTLLLYPRMLHPNNMLLERALIVAGTFLLIGVYRRYPSRITLFLRVAGQLSLLAYWYPDTFEFNRLFNNLDPLFAYADEFLFGCQPSLVLSKLFPSLWVSEAFNFGYFCYYPLIFLVVVYYFFFKNEHFEKISFVLIASFFVYYLIYIAIPVAGPQFYFRAVGVDKIHAGVFPFIGDYFNENNFLVTGMKFDGGFFYKLVEASQEVGERPTAAFPSSHVGVSTIIMLMAWRANRRMTYGLLPIYLLLCGATVYIQAHYLIDSIMGFVSGIGIYILTSWVYRRWFTK